MKSKNSFIGYSLLGVIGGLIVAGSALIFTGAGHSPHVDFWIGLFKFGLFIALISSIVFIIALIVRASSA